MNTKFKILTTSLLASSLLAIPQFALADITVNNASGKLDTATQDNITVTSAGSVTGAGGDTYAILMNKVGGAFVSNAGQILGTGAGTYGINVTVANHSKINNLQGGLISGTSKSAIRVGADLTDGIYNAGSITHNGGENPIEIGAKFVNLVNYPTGQITNNSNGGVAIDFTADTQGAIVNSGSITVGDLGTGINVANKLNGAIFNTASGSITTGNMGTGIDVTKDISFGNIINQGKIDSMGGIAIKVDSTASITNGIDNSGTLLGKVIIGKNTLNIQPGAVIKGDIEGETDSIVNLNAGLGTFTSGGTFDKITTVNFNGGTINMNNTIGAVNPSTNINVGMATLNLNANTASADFNNNMNGTIAIDKSISHSGNFTQSAGVLQVTLVDKTNFGQLKVSGDIKMANTGTIRVISPVSTSSSIKTGDTFDIITVGGKSVVDAAKLDVQANLLLTFNKGLAPNNKDIRLTATRVVPTTTDLGSFGDVLTSLINSPNIDSIFKQVFTELESIISTIALDNAIRSLGPDNSNGGYSSIMSTIDSIFNNVLMHLYNTTIFNITQNDDDTVSGYAAGSKNAEHTMWGRVLGIKNAQKLRKRVPGYSADSFGYIIGFDKQVSSNLTVGFAGSYTYTDIDTKNATRNNSKIRAYQATMYGSYAISESFIELMAAYAWSNFDTIRNIGVAGFTSRALADFSGHQYSTRLSYSTPIVSDNMSMIPSLFIMHNYATQSAYVERNANSLNLSVRKNRINKLEVGFSSRYNYPMKTLYGQFMPHFEFGVRHDIIGKTPYTYANFVGAGGLFRVNGAPPANTTLDLGTGFTMTPSENLSFVMALNGSWKKNNLTQSANFDAKYRF